MPEAKNGFLDLSNLIHQDIQKDFVILNGEWKFFWNESKNEKLPLTNNLESETIIVPSSWNQKLINDKKIGSFGYATYFLQVKIPENWKNKILLLRADYHAGAYEIFVNAALSQSVGKFGTTKETSKNVHSPSLGYIYANSDILNILIHESNFEHRVGGIGRPLYLGLPNAINTISNQRRNSDLFSISVLFIIGLYYIFYFLIRKSDKSNLIFALLCFFLLIRAFVQNEQILREFYPNGNYKLFLLIEYSAMYFSPSIALHFFSLPIEYPYKNKYLIISYSISFLYFFYAIFLDTYSISLTVLQFQYIVLLIAVFTVLLNILAIYKRVKYSWISLCSMFVALITIIIDMMIIQEKIQFPFTASYGLIFMIFTQGIILAVRHSEAYRTNEKLTNELTLFNENLENKVKERTLELNLAIERMEKSVKARNEFLANMSHEIRTPMNIISGMAQLLDESDLKPEQKEYVSLFNIANKTLLNVLNDVLDLSKLEQGFLTIDSHDFKIDELFSDLNKIFQFKTKGTLVTFEILIDQNVPLFVKGDSNRISQILFNLLSNAFKFTNVGKVVLSLSIEDNGFFVFKVRDTGIGMTEEKISKLFIRFYQAHDSNQIFQRGTGLGLAISKKLVELMKGTISVKSSLGEGSEFKFKIPLDIATPKNFENSQFQQTNKQFENLKVFVIDDVQENLLIVKKFLEKKVSVIYLSTGGIEAVSIYEENLFDIVLMDIQMPNLNGFDMLKIFRKIDSDRFHFCPIVAFTANVTLEEQREILEAGFSGFLSKPVSKKDVFDKFIEILK
ncbi:signal transduction histidine kinase [Leptospira meyeri]|uniref:histidine kinase n=1 Tax=Leptospira meyeri TaxID=29508 RepID=A0A4R8MV74_LEPME|nr:ATP-binding protein [Leptospira meyeri]EKJ87652.1 GHKL domain protein [Leptospira meyeri serovar Hardjo str. Went 5]TDY73303.1 signal transduction histidine kinase [Leptospira meyeri]